MYALNMKWKIMSWKLEADQVTLVPLVSHFAEHRSIFGGAHAQCLSREFILGPKKPPILHRSLLPTMVGQNEKKKSVKSGHLPIILFYLICSSKMISTLTEWKYFPKISSDGPFIAPFTWRPAHAVYYAFRLACSTAAVYGNLKYVADIDASITHSWYNTTGSVLIGRPALSEMTP